MKYKQAFTKMPESLQLQFGQHAWARSLLEQGGDYAELLASREAMERLLPLLSERERYILQLIVTKLGCSLFTLELLEKHASSSRCGADVHVALTGLRKYGIILGFRKSWGELLYALPPEGLSIWQALLLDEPVCKAINQQPHIERIDDLLSGSRGLAQELFALVVYAARHDIHLTSKGTLHKKQQQQVSNRLRMPNISWNRESLANLSSGSDETGLALLVDFAVRLGILHKEAGILKLDFLTWSVWLCLIFEQQQAVLYKLWKELQHEPPLWLQHGMSVIETMTRDKWCSLDEIVRWMNRNEIPFHPFSLIELKDALLRRWIAPLSTFRWLESGKNSDGEVWFRWLIDPHASNQIEETRPQSNTDAFYVQPDFELLLPPSISSLLEWEIALFADPVSLDDMRVYRITKETFCSALEAGKHVDEIIQFLMSHAIYQVPSSVQQTLTEWGQQFGKLQFVDITLLRVRSAEIAEVIRASENCRDYIQAPIGDTDFIVHKEQVPAFHKLLEQMGYHPQLLTAVQTPSTSISLIPNKQDSFHEKPSLGSIQKKEWFEVENAFPKYELAPSLAEVEELYPDLQDIPPLWLKEYREYHESTRKDMIRKAIEWKSCLKIRKEGLERRIMPQRLQEDRSGWTLFGMEDTQEIMLCREDWKEMKLILPGINEP